MRIDFLMYMENPVAIIYSRVKTVVLRPGEFWDAEKSEDPTGSRMTWQFALPLLILIALAVFVGEFFRSTHFYVGFALLKSLKSLVLYVSFYFLATYLTNTLIGTFGGQKSIQDVRKLVGYSLTPMLLVSVLTGLFPGFLYVIDVLGMYGFFIFWVGGKKLLVLPEQRKESYLLITIVVNFFIFSFLSVFLSKLLTAWY